MTVALRSPDRVATLIPVDNAPVDAALKSDFGKYIQGMRKIEDAHVTKQSEADSILKEFEEVSSLLLVKHLPNSWNGAVPNDQHLVPSDPPVPPYESRQGS